MLALQTDSSETIQPEVNYDDVPTMTRLDTGHLMLGDSVLLHGQKFAYYQEGVWHLSQIVFNKDANWYHDKMHHLVVGLHCILVDHSVNVK